MTTVVVVPETERPKRTSRKTKKKEVEPKIKYIGPDGLTQEERRLENYEITARRDRAKVVARLRYINAKPNDVGLAGLLCMVCFGATGERKEFAGAARLMRHLISKHSNEQQFLYETPSHDYTMRHTEKPIGIRCPFHDCHLCYKGDVTNSKSIAIQDYIYHQVTSHGFIRNAYPCGKCAGVVFSSADSAKYHFWDLHVTGPLDKNKYCDLLPTTENIAAAAADAAAAAAVAIATRNVTTT